MKWTPEQDALLLEHYGRELTKVTAARIGVSAGAAQSRMLRLRHPRRASEARAETNASFRTLDQIEQGMLALAGRFYGPAYAAELHGVSPDDVRAAMRAERTEP